MSKEYLDGENLRKNIIVILNFWEKKMKPLVYFVVGLIGEISGGKIDDICADQNVLVNDFFMPFRRDTSSLRYDAEHGRCFQ